jgi:iron(III) transport system substrate-binding protein
MYVEVVEEVKKALSSRFPDYQIEFIQSGTGIIQQRVEIERASGRLGADILMVADPAYSLELKERGMLHPFRSAEAAFLAFDYDPQGYWYPVRVSNMVLAYNPQRYARNAVPNSFYDFVHDSRVTGAISMRNPLVSGTTMATITALGDRYGNDFFDALGRQRVLIDYGSEETMTRLETGESAVVMILEESILQVRQERNSRMEVIYPSDGTIVIPSNIMIINDRWSANMNTAAAELIVEWFLSIEGQTAIVNGWMHSVRSDFPQPPNGSIPIEQILANSISVNWEYLFRQRREIQTRFEEALTAWR